MTRAVKPPPTLLNPEQLKFFDASIKKWQGLLGLDDWRIVRTGRKTKNMAEVAISHHDRLAVYKVGNFGAEGTSPYVIESTALHEELHILLAEIVNQVEYGITGDALASAEHRVINTLEKLLLSMDRKAA